MRSDMCSICYEQTTQYTSCRHPVCSTCLSRIYTCPLCRKELHSTLQDDFTLWIRMMGYSICIVILSVTLYQSFPQLYLFIYVIGVVLSIVSVYLLTDPSMSGSTQSYRTVLI